MITVEEHLDRKIFEIAQDIQRVLGPTTFRKVYQTFWKRYVDCQLIDAYEKIPEMIALMRETKDASLFAMIVCFLNHDYTFAHLTLNYALHEWQPHREE